MPARRVTTPRQPDLRLGSTLPILHNAPDQDQPHLPVARHTVHTSTADYHLILVGSDRIGRRELGQAIADAVAELRAIDVTYSPLRENSLISLLRRGVVAAEIYPPLADIVGRCEAMRAATHGWFDPWAVPGGFDPAGMIKGWAIERTADRLRAAGVADYAVVSGGDLTVRGHGPHAAPWRIAINPPTPGRSAPMSTGGAPDDGPASTATPHDASGPPAVITMTSGAIGTSGLGGRPGPIINPRSGEPVDRSGVAIVSGPDLAVADGYATALYAAGPAGLDWFPTEDGYRRLAGGTA